MFPGMPGYGPHMTIDLYGCDPAILNDYRGINAFMKALPTKLGMEVLFPPYTHDFENPNPKESGVTSIVGLTTSHASVHTYPFMTSTKGEVGIAFIDIFSCRPFDIEMAMELVRDFFKPQREAMSITQRGREFPPEADRS